MTGEDQASHLEFETGGGDRMDGPREPPFNQAAGGLSGPRSTVACALDTPARLHPDRAGSAEPGYYRRPRAEHGR